MNIALLRVAATAIGVACAASLLLAGRAAATPPARLLADYQPELRFDPLESFRPTSVQSFVSDSNLERLVGPGTWSVVDTDPEPGALPGPGSGTWRLNQDTCSPAAAIGGLACYAGAWEDGSGAPVVYGRVTHDEGKIVLQYWYFYYANTYSYLYPPSDFIWQAHEGDWELVNVVLSADEEPELVGYSQHCAGERRTWANAPRTDETHPLVQVAIGSHANYFAAGTHAINPACIPPQALAIIQLNHLQPPVDYAYGGPAALEGERPTMPIHRLGDDRPSWLGFPGFWGELQYFHAPPPIGSVAFATSPVGPAYHADWGDPLGAMATWSG